MTHIADNKEIGMAIAEINAVLMLKRKKYKIEITIVAPTIMSNLKPLIDASIKFAGLNKSG